MNNEDKAVCKIDGCGSTDIKARGMCGRCYGAVYRRNILEGGNFPPVVRGPLGGCSIEDCKRAYYGRGFCYR